MARVKLERTNKSATEALSHQKSEMALVPRNPKLDRDLEKSRYILNVALRSLFAGYLPGSTEDRDMDAEFKYPQKPYNIEDYKWWYTYNGPARRVVEIYAEECWASTPEVTENDKLEETPCEKGVVEFFTEHNTLSDLEKLDIAQGIGSCAIIYHGYNDVDEDGEQDLEQPVAKLHPVTGDVIGPIKGLKQTFTRVFDESQFKVLETETNPNTARCGMPTLYSIDFGEETQNTLIQDPNGEPGGQKVHWTRVFHSADNKLSSRWFGHSRLEPVLEYIYDMKKVGGGSAEMYWRAAMPGYSFETQEGLLKDADMDSIRIDTDSVKEQIQLFTDGLQRFVATVGMTAKSLAPQVTAPNEHLNQYLQLISMTCKIPLRTLIGTESGHLASSQDKGNWNTRKARRRDRYLTPEMLLPYVHSRIALGFIPKNKQPLKVKWPDPSIESDAERAEVVLKMVQALVQYMTSEAARIISPETLLTDLFGLSTEKAQAYMKKATDFLKTNSKFLPKRPEDMPQPTVVGGGQKGNAKKKPAGRPKGKLEKAK